MKLKMYHVLIHEIVSIKANCVPQSDAKAWKVKNAYFFWCIDGLFLKESTNRQYLMLKDAKHIKLHFAPKSP